MRTPLSILLAVALSLVLPACGGEVRVSNTWAGMSAGSGDLGVTGGGRRVATGKPTLYFGTLLEGDRRSFTYLVIAAHAGPSSKETEQRWSGRSTADGATLYTDHTLEVDGVTLRAGFTASVVDGAVTDARTTLGGAPTEAGAWLFLFDGARPEAGFVAHEAEMPELPLDEAQLGGFVATFADDLIASDPTLRAFAGD